MCVSNWKESLCRRCDIDYCWKVFAEGTHRGTYKYPSTADWKRENFLVLALVLVEMLFFNKYVMVCCTQVGLLNHPSYSIYSASNFTLQNFFLYSWCSFFEPRVTSKLNAGFNSTKIHRFFCCGIFQYFILLLGTHHCSDLYIN